MTSFEGFTPQVVFGYSDSDALNRMGQLMDILTLLCPWIPHSIQQLTQNVLCYQ